MTCHDTQINRAPTVTIPREHFRGLCDALLAAGNCREQLLLVEAGRHKRSCQALGTALELLQQIEYQLRATTGG